MNGYALSFDMDINLLKQIDWFCKSVRDIRGYKVEDWSDFTPLIKQP